MQIEIYDGFDACPHIGGLAMDPYVVKALGGPVTTGPQDRWFVARVDGDVVGMAAVRRLCSGCQFKHAYVRRSYRKRGIYTALLEARLQSIDSEQRVTCVATAMSEPLLSARGFCVVSRTKRFARMVRSPLQ